MPAVFLPSPGRGRGVGSVSPQTSLRSPMRPRILLPAVALIAAAGCGGDPSPLPMATTPDAARAALTTALDGWKAGETREGLAARTPPVRLADADFARGAKLVDYKVEGDGKVVGTGMSYLVTLTVQTKDSAATRKVAYRVVTTPHTAVTREDGIP